MQDGFGCGAHAAAPRSCRNRRFTESPIDALVHLVVWNGLCRHVPIWLSLHPVIHLRITTVTPQRWPACRGDVRWLRICPDVIEYLHDVGPVRDEGDQAHLATAAGTLHRYGRSARPTGSGQVSASVARAGLARPRSWMGARRYTRAARSCDSIPASEKIIHWITIIAC